MSTLLDSIQQRLDNYQLAELGHPHFEIEDGDHVVGVVEDERCRKLFGLGRLYRRKTEEVLIAAKYAGLNTDEGKVKALEAFRFKIYADLIMDIFWVSLREEFNVWEEIVGIRENWQVVWSNQRPPTIFDFLDEFSGM